MGLEDALAYWKTQDDFEVIFVTEEGEVVATEVLKDSFTFDGKGNDYTYRVAKKIRRMHNGHFKGWCRCGTGRSGR